MHWSEGFIAVDWGTTNRRAWRIAPDSKVGEEFEDDRGVLSVERGDFPSAVGQIRERLGDMPLLMAGMVGSNRGWVEAPYVPCPAGVDELAAKLAWPEEGRTAVVAGLSFISETEADIMRGEEVQIFGAIGAGMIPPNGLICHPGTHNKWITVKTGKVVRFRTVMTGEMFNLLKEESILSDLLGDKVEPDDAFRSGVKRGLNGMALTAELFSVRAHVLLGKKERSEAAAFTSGLLIGEDLSVGIDEEQDGEIQVMGRPELTRLYSAALAEAGRGAREIDGEQAFLAGIKAIAERI